MKTFFLFSISENVPLRFATLEQQRFIQPSRRADWPRLARDKVTDLLENALLQDPPRYEDRPSNELHCHQQVRQFIALTDR